MKYNVNRLDKLARNLFKEERAIKRLDGWFILRETILDYEQSHKNVPAEQLAADALLAAVNVLPLSLSKNAIFAGTQRDAFAQSYALINPNFKVSTFNGYCDPTAVFSDIEPNGEFTEKRITSVRSQSSKTAYIKELSSVYKACETDTEEVVYFVEQVTGHLIPDFRPAIKYGIKKIQQDISDKLQTETDEKKRINYSAMLTVLNGVEILARRYAALADEQAETADNERKAELKQLSDTLKKAPLYGAESLFDAIQCFILLWQMMCLEQAPNPFAFSVGNADRIFNEYYKKENISREEACGLFKHFLLFFNVGSRSWAISQNILVSGKNNDGNDLTNATTYALLDAYHQMNLPQPILSVKLHKNTPDELYKELGKFFFTPGCLTPSLFNDDVVFPLLKNNGVKESDLPDYSVAGCQEPLIMGKDNGNTTNSWLSLPKILELILNDGKSTITGNTITDKESYNDAKELLSTIRERFYKKADHYIDRMVDAANGASRALSNLKVPFLSCFMGGIETGYDTRDTENQGTEYNGSGCLIHGLSVVADSFVAIDKLLEERPEDSERLLDALRNNFEGYEDLREYLLSCPKFGNNVSIVDKEAAEIATRISKAVKERKNYLGNPFRPDWSSPTTHLTYGYWVGATPDGRKAREMLNYGVDPLYGTAENGLGFRILSLFNLDFTQFNGGYASHLGLDPKYFRAEDFEGKGVEFKNKIVTPLFFSSENEENAPFYLYVNVTTPDILRKVLANPKKYAPSGVYIMRIHGTFVNFLDLSPDVQQDIIKRLDLNSTTGC